MKKPEYAIDRKEFEKFWERVQKEAKRHSGGSHVDVRMRDCTRDAGTDGIPVSHPHNIETDAEWREAIGRLSCNVKSAADRLDTYLRLYDMEKRSEEGKAALARDFEDLARFLGVTIRFGERPPLPEGKRWVHAFGIERAEVGHPSSFHCASLWEYREDDRKKMVAWAKAGITAALKAAGSTHKDFLIEAHESAGTLWASMAK